MVPNSDGSLLRLNDNGGLLLSEFFGQSGAGADLTVWVQTNAGTASFAANDMDKVGTNYVNFNVPASERAILTGIGGGDRFLLALTRPVPQHGGDGRPEDHGHGPGRGDPDCRDQRHRRRRGSDQRGLHLPMAGRRRGTYPVPQGQPTPWRLPPKARRSRCGSPSPMTVATTRH